MNDTQSIIRRLTDAYDEAIADLDIEDAVAVAEELQAFVEASLYGLRDDLDNQ